MIQTNRPVLYSALLCSALLCALLCSWELPLSAKLSIVLRLRRSLSLPLPLHDYDYFNFDFDDWLLDCQRPRELYPRSSFPVVSSNSPDSLADPFRSSLRSSLRCETRPSPYASLPHALPGQ